MADKRPFIIFGIAAVLILTFFIYFSNKSDRYSWDENYRESNKSPYGTFVVYNLLQRYSTDHMLADISKSIPDDLPAMPIDSVAAPANYVFIGEGLYLDSTSTQHLLDFVKSGNVAFISSKSIPYVLMDSMLTIPCTGQMWYDYSAFEDTSVTTNLIHKDLKDPYSFKFEFLYRSKPQPYYWQYIDSAYFCKANYLFTRLGEINGQFANFAKMSYGDGAFYLHTTPIAFSNIQLLRKEGLSYANKIFSHLGEGPIFWDKISRVDEEISRRRNQMATYDKNIRLDHEGPLSYILKQQSLAWAWYLALATGFLYLFFRAKRTQRIIPVLDVNANTSLEFISTIGRLYFLQNDHKKLCLQKMKLFLSYVRERYNMPAKQIDENFVKSLSLRSEVPEKTIGKIALMYQNINNSSFVSEKTMIDFHLEMEKFYKHRK